MLALRLLNLMALLWDVAGNPLPTTTKPGSIGGEWTFGSGHDKRQAGSCNAQSFQPGVVNEAL
jgi:hypothetical protein